MAFSGASPRSRGDAQRLRARAEWGALRDRLLTVTPAAAGRAVLVTTVLVLAIGVVAATWPALSPFVVGGLIAWGVLPVVDSLDRIMPRPLAAILSVVGVVALAVAVIVIVVPVLTTAILEFASSIPPRDQIEQQVATALGNLPSETRDLVAPILTTVLEATDDTLAGTSTTLHDLVQQLVRSAPQIAGAILGLLVLPTWVVTVMTSNRRARLAVDVRVARWMRTDFWAIVRIADRSVRTFIRQYVAVAAAVGFFTYLGLVASPQVGGPTYLAPLAIAVFAGTVQMVPELGPILGFLPALLLVVLDPPRAVAYIVIYIVARWLGRTIVEGRLVRDPTRLDRVIVIPAVVVLSQLGPLALLLSAPILAFGTDSVRYLHGRLSEPPRPAGLLPGEPLPKTPRAATAAVPLVYRQRRAVPNSQTATLPASSAPR